MEIDGTLEIPMGMAMTIAEDPGAMEAFCRLSSDRRAEIVSKARNVKSREEMTALVRDLAKMG